MSCYLQAFVNTFQESNVEATYSRRLLYILESKTHLIETQVIDVNQELANCFRDKGSEVQNLRQTLQQKYNLINNGPQGGLVFPQIFLCVPDAPAKTLRSSVAWGSKKKPMTEDWKKPQKVVESTLSLALNSIKKGEELEVTRSLFAPITEVFQEEEERKEMMETKVQKFYVGDYLGV
jgi:hypothetical protein